MKRLCLGAAVLMISTTCAAQMPSHSQANGVDPHAGTQNSQGVVPSNRNDFGRECGISDPSAQRAIRLSRSSAGAWSEMSADKIPGPQDDAVARVWRESNWMVDMHEAPGHVMTSMHTGQMCFDARGRITRMIDRYMDMASGCLRFTVLTFADDGRVVRREQRFMNVRTDSEMAVPESAPGFPEVWGFRRLEQLPFYSLVKK